MLASKVHKHLVLQNQLNWACSQKEHLSTLICSHIDGRAELGGLVEDQTCNSRWEQSSSTDTGLQSHPTACRLPAGLTLTNIKPQEQKQQQKKQERRKYLNLMVRWYYSKSSKELTQQFSQPPCTDSWG